MTRRLLIFSLLLFVFACGCFGRRIAPEQAQQYAHNFWLQKDGPRRAVLQPVATEFSNIYLFVDTAGHGFVLLAADDRSIPVLGYSLENNFVAEDMPAAVHDWIQDYNDQIQYLIDNNIEKTSEINAQWQDLNNERSLLPKAYPTAKGPLIQSNWGQGTPFNNYCPSNYTGCVATAMAQIMNYHKFPNRGMGTNTYIPYYFTTPITVSFADSVFDWANMINSYTYDYDQPYPYPPLWNETQANAVARLMKCVGVAVDMSYGPKSTSYASSAKTISANYDEPSAVNAYRKYFKYKWTVRGVCQADYSNDDWKALLKNEIDNNRPMQYGGANTGTSGGHSFICDGYDTDGKFHFNWGGAMGGISYTEYGGYYEVSDINKYDIYGSEKFGFNLNKYAIIGIEPDDTASTKTTITVTATSNNTAWGTVTGGGIFTKYSQTVTLTPVANEGYKFVGWSNGSRDVPLKFLANGDDAALVANFAPVNGESLYYCNGACIATYGSNGSTKFWGIRIPASSLDQGSKLTDVEFFASIPDTYYINIYEGDFETGTLVSSFSTSVSKYNSWIKTTLTNEWNIDNTKDLCVAIESHMCAASMSAATPNASFEADDPQYGWTHKLNAGGKDVAWCIKAITLTPGTPHSLTINQNAVNLTTISQDVNLNGNGGLAVSNKSATVMYQLISCTPNGIATMDPDDTHITTTGVGTVRIKAYANHAQYGLAEHIVDLTVGRGTLEFTKAYGYWSDPNNWSPLNIVPDSVNHDVLINKVCYVADGQQCHDLSFGTLGTLYVESEAVLNVSGELDNSDPTSLVIKSDENNSGTVIFKSGSPKATVEMYMKGTIGTDGKDPDWQLRGCVVDDFETVDGYFDHYWNNVHAYEWDETNNANGCWDDTRMDGLAISLEPWKGYGFANYSTSPVTVEYKGTLINSDHTWTLTKTGSGNANVGNNMLTNSYSAPIEISKLKFNNAKKSVIFYNTGSLVEWQQYHGDTANSGKNAGQMLVCPLWTAGPAGLPTAIPSGQSFYVVANQYGATVSVDYKDVMSSASGPMFAPAAETKQFNVLGITISGESGADRAVLIECESCTDDYDDGYDGMKYYGKTALPQLFVVNAFGNTSINASESIIDKRLGVHTSASGERLKMTFETEKLEGYSQLKLHDLKNGKYADILTDDKYEFITTGDDESRFEIVGYADGDDDQMSDGLIVAGNTLLVGPDEGTVRMFDASGKLVWQSASSCGGWIELPEVMHGVYIIKSDNTTIKIVK